MKNTPVIAAALVLVSLAACKPEAEEVTSVAPDPMASQLANAAQVELPPSIASSATLRCGDNSLVYVEFFQGDKQVNLRTEKGGSPTMLKAAEAGAPFEAEGGYKLTGTPKSVSVTLPGKEPKTCRA
jgi:hypothetical protein